MSIRRRLEALERRASSSDGMMIITILGGLPEPFLRTATAGPDRWQQQPDESLDDFRDRVATLVHSAGCKLVIIGGLTERDMWEEQNLYDVS